MAIKECKAKKVVRSLRTIKNLNKEIADAADTIEQLLVEIDLANRYFAELNGCDWIKPIGAGEIDMRQRSKAIQKRLAKVLFS